MSEFTKLSESSLAGKLKDVAADVLGFNRNLLDDDNLKEVPFEFPIILTESHISNALNRFKVPYSEELKSKLSYLIGTNIATPRKAAQVIGTEILRSSGDMDIHCKNMEIDPRYSITAVTDVRFLNEYDYFNNDNNIIFAPVFIRRPSVETTNDTHPSEMEVYSIFKTREGYSIFNDGSVSDLEKKVFVLINNILAKQAAEKIRKLD